MRSSEERQTKTEVWAELCFRDTELDFSRITAAVDLKPTKTWKRGTSAYRGKTSMTWKDDGWRWSTDHEFSLDLPRHVEKVVEIILLKSDEVRTLLDSGMTGYVEGISIVDNDDYPELVFSNHLLGEIAAMGLYLAFDLIAKI
jgi:hypothetical protein